MAKIDEATEKDICYWNRFKKRNIDYFKNIEKATSIDNELEFKNKLILLYVVLQCLQMQMQ